MVASIRVSGKNIFNAKENIEQKNLRINGLQAMENMIFDDLNFR